MKFKNVVPITLFSQYTKYLCDWSEGRLCQTTVDYMNITNTEFSIGYALHDGSGPVSISIASKNWPFAVIVTHPDFRGMGCAEIVLRRTLNHFSLANKTYITWVAADNESSVRLLERCGLTRVETATKIRSSGEYVAYRYSSKSA